MKNKFSMSAIICTKDRFNEVLICVNSILTQTIQPEEIVIIDSSENNTLEIKLKDLLKDKPIEVNYLNFDANLTKARNMGIEISKNQIVTFLDDDTVLDKNYFEEILKVFYKYKDINLGGVSGNIINGNQSLVRDFFNKLFFLFRYSNGTFRLSGIQTFVAKSVNNVMKVDSLSGANMSFKKDIIKQFGFDENSPCSEDDDVAWRISRKFQNMYTPFALIEHNPPELGGYGKRSERWEKEIVGLHNHFKKNIPSTFKHRIAFKIALLGLVINELINVIFMRKGSMTQLIGVIKGINSI